MEKKLDIFRDKIYEMLDWAIGNNHIDQVTADEILKPMVDEIHEELKIEK